MLMQWFSNLNGGKDVEYFALFFFGQKYPIYNSCSEGAVAPSLSLELFLTWQ
jgi:hypothetical protein